jgi:hypothetical protein
MLLSLQILVFVAILEGVSFYFVLALTPPNVPPTITLVQKFYSTWPPVKAMTSHQGWKKTSSPVFLVSQVAPATLYACGEIRTNDEFSPKPIAQV